MVNNCEFCIYAPITNSISIKDYLQEILGVSGNLLKKNFKKNFLETRAEHKKYLNLPLDFVNQGIISPVYEGEEIKVIFEDEKFLVINKPHNIHGHALNYSEKDNCLSFIRSSGRGKLLEVNKGEHERGLLYRLDYVTSGVLIYVKQQKLYEQLRANFLLAAKEKKYLALVEGDFQEEGVVELYFEASGSKGHKIIASKIPQHDSAQKGVMFVKKISSSSSYSLIEIELKSGLRHQIRSALSFLSYPILGDELYGGKKSDRVYLHALRYKLEVYNDDCSFESGFPKSFNSFLE